MSNPVMIKGNRYGITLVLEQELPFPKLCDRIRMKFIESARFFDSSTQMAITFEGRELTSEQQAHIIEIINNCCDLDISYIIDRDVLTEQIFAAGLAQQEDMREADKEEENVSVSAEKAIQQKQEEGERETDETEMDVIPKHALKETVGSIENQTSNINDMEVSDDLGHFYRGTLRSGQSIEFASSIVVIGDVNPGAKVVAKGNIIVIGSLKGAAYAGVNGSQNAFIIALDMDPMQLRIGDLYARSPDSKGFLKKKKQPSKEMQIAFVENNNIYIEPINRSVLNSII